MTQQTLTSDASAGQRPAAQRTVFAVLFAVSICHLLNDTMQSLVSSIYPILKEEFRLDFWQIGLLTLSFQVTASLLQPIVGIYTDKRPLPYSLPVSMGFTLLGLLALGFADRFGMLLCGGAMVGIGSAIFHPESSRVARLASGGKYGLAQSIFQVGGNLGASIGPLLAAFIVAPHAHTSVASFSILAFFSMLILWQVSGWYARFRVANAASARAERALPFPPTRTVAAICVLALLVLTKHTYMASLTSYYTFYVIERFGLTVQQSQIMLFLFLGAVAFGTIIGGPVGDRIGTRTVIWISILGVLPFSLVLPYADLFWTGVLTIIIGVVIASAFPAIVVFAQELVPGRVGMIGGLFFGFAFGFAGIAAALLGLLADAKGLDFVYNFCSYLPLLGLLTILLPDMRDARRTG